MDIIQIRTMMNDKEEQMNDKEEQIKLFQCVKLTLIIYRQKVLRNKYLK